MSHARACRTGCADATTTTDALPPLRGEGRKRSAVAVTCKRSPLDCGGVMSSRKICGRCAFARMDVLRWLDPVRAHRVPDSGAACRRPRAKTRSTRRRTDLPRISRHHPQEEGCAAQRGCAGQRGRNPRPPLPVIKQLQAGRPGRRSTPTRSRKSASRLGLHAARNAGQRRGDRPADHAGARRFAPPPMPRTPPPACCRPMRPAHPPTSRCVASRSVR